MRLYSISRIIILLCDGNCILSYFWLELTQHKQQTALTEKGLRGTEDLEDETYTHTGGGGRRNRRLWSVEWMPGEWRLEEVWEGQYQSSVPLAPPSRAPMHLPHPPFAAPPYVITPRLINNLFVPPRCYTLSSDINCTVCPLQLFLFIVNCLFAEIIASSAYRLSILNFMPTS